MLKKILLTLLGLFGGGALILFLTLKLVLNQPVPEAEFGPAAEELAAKIEAATKLDAWERTAAVAFRFDRRGNRHFYDQGRDFVEVRLPGDEQLRVQYNHRNQNQFVAFAGKTRLAGEAAAEALSEAIKWHTNDLFWLNPFATLRAPGAELGLVGERALLVRFSSGGVTPGDQYLIVTDTNFRPVRFQMWVSILPIQGLEFSFEGWKEYESGALLSNIHKSNLTNIDLSQIRTYSSYPVPGEEDRFAPLLKEIAAAN